MNLNCTAIISIPTRIFNSNNRGIVFIQLQGNDIVVNFQGNMIIQKTYLFTKNIFIQGNYQFYSFKELYSFQ